eukprot:44443_1
MAFIANQAKRVGAGSTWKYLGKIGSNVGTAIKQTVNKDKDKKQTNSEEEGQDNYLEKEQKEKPEVMEGIEGTQETDTKPDDWAIDWTKGDQINIHPSYMAYHSARESLQNYGIKNNLRQQKPSLNMASECAYLSNWIYYIDSQPLRASFREFDYKKIVRSNKSTQVAQWVFLYSSKSKTAYLIFKGTDVDNPQDILTDLGIIPYPMYPKQGEKEISGHALMEATITRDYDIIKQEIQSKDIDNLYITGHSLGGGLAVMFGLKAIIDHIIHDDESVHIITFGAPSVIAIEKELDKLSAESKQILKALHKMTHCFVNSFDIVPRILSSSGVKWIDFIMEATTKYVENWREKIMSQVENIVHQSVLQQNMKQEDEGSVWYGLNQFKADTIGFVGQSAISLVKTIRSTAEMGWNMAKGDDMSLAVTLKMIELTDDEFKMSDEDDDQKCNAETLGSFQGILTCIKENAKHNLLLYHPFGTYYFCVNGSDECIVSDNRQEIQKMSSFIPTRLSFSTENMQMLLLNHSMAEYVKIFNPDLKGKMSVTGYLVGIGTDITNGEPCGSGEMFWVVHDTKYTPIGKICLEQHIGDGDTFISKMRGNAFWSKHCLNWRIRFNVWGYINSNIEICAAATYDEVRVIFDKY